MTEPWTPPPPPDVFTCSTCRTPTAWPPKVLGWLDDSNASRFGVGSAAETFVQICDRCARSARSLPLPAPEGGGFDGLVQATRRARRRRFDG